MARYSDLLNSVLQLEVTNLGERPIDVEATFRTLPNVVVATSSLSPLSMIHIAGQAAAGDDNFVISLPTEGRAAYRQRGRADATCAPGEGYLLLNEEPSEIRNGRSARVSLAVSRACLAPRIRDIDRALRDKIPSSPALRLLVGYAGVLTTDVAQMPPGVEHRIADHVCDLLAIALGGPQEISDPATQSGVRAARLAAIKADVAANLTHHDLSLETIAARHGISPQYVRSLFNSEGTTFRDFVLGERLALVHRAITDPASVRRPISAIAYEAGFGDLSYFNRAFRRKHGMTPSDVRAAALRDRGTA